MEFGKWNYRIVKHVRQPSGCTERVEYGLHEVYYAVDGQIMTRTEDAVVYRDSPEEIVEALEMMLKAAKKNLDPQDIIDDATTQWSEM